MKLTPLDLKQQTFKKNVRGYDPQQVNSFLELVCEEWEALLKEGQQMKERLARQEVEIDDYQDKERTLRETLVSAQKMANDLRQTAKKEADIILSQAELQADKIIHQAHRRLTEIIDEINELKRQRAEFEGRLFGMIESHRRLLDLQSDARDRSQIEDVAVLSPKSV